MEGFRGRWPQLVASSEGRSRHPAITRRTESGRSSATNSRVRGDPARPRPRRPGAGAPWAPLAPQIGGCSPRSSRRTRCMATVVERSRISARSPGIWTSRATTPPFESFTDQHT